MSELAFTPDFGSLQAIGIFLLLHYGLMVAGGVLNGYSCAIQPESKEEVIAHEGSIVVKQTMFPNSTWRLDDERLFKEARYPLSWQECQTSTGWRRVWT
jgi:hypothetical protein